MVSLLSLSRQSLSYLLQRASRISKSTITTNPCSTCSRTAYHTRGVDRQLRSITTTSSEKIVSSKTSSSSTSLCVRLLSSTSGGGGGGGGDNDDNDGNDGSGSDDNNNENTTNNDPFGVTYDDGNELGKIGPPNSYPPKYKRDNATGKLLNDMIIEPELTIEERELLQMDSIQHDKLLISKLFQHWKKSKKSNNNKEEQDEEDKIIDDFGKRVRLAKMSLNILGRSTKAQSTKSILDNGEEFGRDPSTEGLTQPLSQKEFHTFQKFMLEQYQIEITEDDIPVHDDAITTQDNYDDDDDDIPTRRNSNSNKKINDKYIIHVQGTSGDDDDNNNNDDTTDPDNPDLSLKWLTSRAKWQVQQKYGQEGPFDDMLPRDLNLSRIVNRKRAKILPRELLHHNNLALLRRYISPAGQIMHRVRTRLGARDQRKIAKLIKRARNLGLIPHTGQFVVEDNGNIHEEDIQEMKPWEEELIRRGLVITPPKDNNKMN